MDVSGVWAVFTSVFPFSGEIGRTEMGSAPSSIAAPFVDPFGEPFSIAGEGGSGEPFAKGRAVA